MKLQKIKKQVRPYKDIHAVRAVYKVPFKRDGISVRANPLPDATTGRGTFKNNI